MFMKQKIAPVAVDQAEAFVALTRRLETERSALPRGAVANHPTRAAIDAATRLVRDRQAIATRLSVVFEGEVVTIDIGVGTDPQEGAARVEFSKIGKPVLLLPGQPPAEHESVTNARFRKSLNAVISAPSTGRVRSKKIEIDGIMFDSTVEGRRYGMLRLDEKLGRIKNLKLQVPYRFDENGVHCFTYIADFVYDIVIEQRTVVEDVKGMRMDVYRLKKKLIEARHGILIEEWPVPRKEMERRLRAEDRARKTAERQERVAERMAKRVTEVETGVKVRRKKSTATGSATVPAA